MSEVKYPPFTTERKRATFATRLGNFVPGMMFGAMVGAGAMLLWAPQSGYRTRADIKNKAHELGEQTSETVDDAVKQLRDKGRQVNKDVRNGAKALEHRGQRFTDEQLDHVTTGIADLKDAVHAG